MAFLRRRQLPRVARALGPDPDRVEIRVAGLRGKSLHRFAQLLPFPRRDIRQQHARIGDGRVRHRLFHAIEEHEVARRVERGEELRPGGGA